MMRLIRQLAACKCCDFSGWFLAEASICLEGEICSFSLEICRKTKRGAILQVLGWDDGGSCRQSLTVLLVKPIGVLQEPMSDCAAGPVADEAVWQYTFSEEEIQAYLAVSGDSNEIHKGKGAVVPGLYFLILLHQSFGLGNVRWRCRFRRPVYIGERLYLIRTLAGMEGYVGGRLVSTIELLPYKERVHNELNNL